MGIIYSMASGICQVVEMFLGFAIFIAAVCGIFSLCIIPLGVRKELASFKGDPILCARHKRKICSLWFVTFVFTIAAWLCIAAIGKWGH